MRHALSRRWSVLLSSVGVALWVGGLVRADSAQYLVTRIGGDESFAHAINSSGVVVGQAGGHAFEYRDGLLHDLGRLDGMETTFSSANGINNAGTVVGSASGINGALRAFIYKDGRLADLGMPSEYRGFATAINSREQIVGAWEPLSGEQLQHAFLYENGRFTDLGALGEGDRSEAAAINAVGQIVGWSFGANPFDPPLHAVLWENGNIIDLGTFGGFSSEARGINDSGKIVGAYERLVNDEPKHRPFVLDRRTGRFTELPVPEAATGARPSGINSAGDIVGSIFLFETGDSRAVLWRGGVMYDLNELIPADSGWELDAALAINDAGQIVGFGLNASRRRGFLLTPSAGAAWHSHDIGTTGLIGSFVLGRDGIFTVRGAGADIWHIADSFHFVHQPLTGDGTIVARLASLTNTHALAKAGVMMRDGLGANAAHVILSVKPGGGVEFMQRGGANEGTMFLAGGVVTLPRWLRLARSGPSIIGSTSQDGITWTTVGTATDTMGERVEAGLAVTSRNRSRLNTARYTGVSLMPAPWSNRDIGNVGMTGNASFNGDDLVVMGAGADIWGGADSFHYVYRELPSVAEISVRVAGLTRTHVFAKAGLMMRNGLAPNAAHVILDVKPDGNVEFMQRAVAGGATRFIAGGRGPWIRLERAGSVVTASVSPDGSTWTTIGSTTASFSTPTMGVAITSRTRSRLTSALLENVMVR